MICSDVQTVACPLKTPSTVSRIGPCGERTLRPCVDDDYDIRPGNGVGLFWQNVKRSKSKKIDDASKKGE